MSRDDSGPAMTTEKRIVYIPITPAGTVCTWLASSTENRAWKKLLKDAAHMPYDGKKGFIERGYTVEQFEEEIL